MDIKEYIKAQIGVDGEWKNASDISTFKGGGQAFVFYPQSTEKAVELLGVLRKEKIAFSMLGKGSNMLVFDGKCATALVSLHCLNSVEIKGKTAVCEGGASIRKIVESGRKHNLGGLEFLSGVPLSLGGAIKMNAGAFLSQTSDYVTKLCILTFDSANCDKIRIEEKRACECGFSYRHGASGIVLKAELSLDDKTREQSICEAQSYLAIRRQKQPALPSLGSVFKNGTIASGKLLDECNLKGVRVGGAKVSELHANFIVNTGGATASDYLNLASFCKKEVYEHTGIVFEEEFRLVD